MTTDVTPAGKEEVVEEVELKSPDKPTHGGMVVVSPRGDRVLAFIVDMGTTHLKESCLPKGHIEKGETPLQAAVREAWEETGVVVTKARKLGRTPFYTKADSTGKEEVVLIEWYAATISELVEFRDHLHLDWVSPEDLTYPDHRLVAGMAIY